ncbi:MAG: hypothetical protein KC438_09245 [Thermomicrobiales bacterium]|nr:hypothetical protein [Thermomicrobiales bacterium]MCO5220090.1 hypothetical protein [Thermomicrobiales bacterium]
MTASKRKSKAESDLDFARERLAFYEQFDEIIKQNIATSSALLKEASARLDSDFASERQYHRALLADILDELTSMQEQNARLARRVSDALDALEGTTTPAPEAAVPVDLVAEAPPEVAAVVNAAATSNRTAPDPQPVVDDPEADTPELASGAAVAQAPNPVVVEPAVPGEPATTTLLVHGVPRASAALALKTYIEQLDFVQSVEPREFAAGLLRLQVDGDRPLMLGDLSGWNLADQIELRNASNDLLEFAIAQA